MDSNSQPLKFVNEHSTIFEFSSKQYSSVIDCNGIQTHNHLSS